VGIATLLATLAVLPATVWILVTLLKRALQRDRDALILLVPTLLWQGFPFIDSILLITWQLGWQRWALHWVFPLLTKPFVLMPGPAVGTIFIFALLLFLIRRFSFARQEETRLSSQLESAHSIQRTLVPPISASFSGYDLNGLSLPSEKVGGDLVDVVLLPNRSILAYVADVSGHGLQAGILMGMVKTAVRTILLESCDDPAFLLASLCDRLNRALPTVKESHMYATLSAICLAPDGRIEYTLAGHPSILYYQASSRTVQALTRYQLPVGLLPVDAYISTPYKLNKAISLPSPPTASSKLPTPSKKSSEVTASPRSSRRCPGRTSQAYATASSPPHRPLANKPTIRQSCSSAALNKFAAPLRTTASAPSHRPPSYSISRAMPALTRERALVPSLRSLWPEGVRPRSKQQRTRV
jgi:Stage II sporulation protein E (SpoIIE)